MSNFEIQRIDDCVQIAVYSDRLDANCLIINLTTEGLIIDSIQSGSVIATSCRMWDEVEAELLADENNQWLP